MKFLLKNNLKVIIPTILLLFSLLVPALVSAEIQWGGVTYIDSGSLQFRAFEHEINNFAPDNSNFAVNAVIRPEASWFPSGGNIPLEFTFYISKDTDLDIDPISPDHRVLSLLVPSDAASADITFRIYENNVSIMDQTLDNIDGSQEAANTSILSQSIASFADVNDEGQPVYACTSYNAGLQETKLGCALLKKSIINPSADFENGEGADFENGEGADFENGGAGQMEFDKLQNPLCANKGDGTVCDTPIGTVTDFIERILNIVIMIGIPIVVLALIWAGFLYVKAQGNSEKIGEAHKTLLWTIIGAALLMGSWAIANAIKETVSQIGTTASLVSGHQDIA